MKNRRSKLHLQSNLSEDRVQVHEEPGKKARGDKSRKLFTRKWSRKNYEGGLKLEAEAGFQVLRRK